MEPTSQAIEGTGHGLDHRVFARAGQSKSSVLRDSGDERRGPLTSGPRLGTSGGRVTIACLAVAALGAAVCTVNALSILDEAARNGEAYPAWKAWGAEFTSFAGILIVLPLAVLVERMASERGGPARRAVLLIAVSLVYSFVHVTVMVGLRHLLWWLRGEPYSFDLGRDWLYEYRKDLLGYVFAIAAIALARRWPGERSAEQRSGEGDSWVSLPDGRRQALVDCAGLRAAHGAGNYVELIFAAGSPRLLRTTLGSVEAALAVHGFRRTHKSCLVRIDDVERLERTPSGDFRLQLKGGFVCPLSRRNVQLIAEVRERLRQIESRAPQD